MEGHGSFVVGRRNKSDWREQLLTDLHGRPMVVPAFPLLQDPGAKSDDLDMKVSANKSWGIFASSILVRDR